MLYCIIQEANKKISRRDSPSKADMAKYQRNSITNSSCAQSLRKVSSHTQKRYEYDVIMLAVFLKNVKLLGNFRSLSSQDLRVDFRANFIDYITKVLVKPSNCGGLIAAGREISARLPAKFAEKTRVIQGENE